MTYSRAQPAREGYVWMRYVGDGEPQAGEIVYVMERGPGWSVTRMGLAGALPLQDFGAYEFGDRVEESV